MDCHSLRRFKTYFWYDRKYFLSEITNEFDEIKHTGMF